LFLLQYYYCNSHKIKQLDFLFIKLYNVTKQRELCEAIILFYYGENRENGSRGAVMENLAIAFWAVCPISLIIVIGYAVGRFKFMSDKTINEANRMSMTVFFGSLSFYNIYNSNINLGAGLHTAIFCFVGVIIEIVLCLVFVHAIEKRPSVQGAMVQALYRGNLMMIGLPLMERVCGTAQLGIMGLTSAFVIPLYNVAAVIVLEGHRGGDVNIKKTLLSILKNPLIIGTTAAILCQALQIRLPNVLENVISNLAGAAAPIGLVLLGASLDMKQTKHNRRNLLVCILGKLVVIPVIAIAFAIMLGLRGASLMTVLIIFGAPVPVAAYVMADQLEADTALTSEAIVGSTIFSCLTMFLGIFVLKQFALI